MDFDMNWVGARRPTPQDATGHIQVALDKGQITGLKPGAGDGRPGQRGCLARRWPSIQRPDDKGFAFTASAATSICGGHAFTDNVLVKGRRPRSVLIGRVGLKNKDYDQTAVVTGNVSNSLPLRRLRPVR